MTAVHADRAERPLLRSTGAADPSASPAPLARNDGDPGANASLLQAILAELHALRSDVDELRRAVAPDLGQRVGVLAGLRGEFGSTAFTALDALEIAAEKPDGDLSRALAPLLGGPVGGLRRLSRRLAKLAGKPAGGLVLARIGSDHNVALYVTQTVQLAVLDPRGSTGAG